MQSFAAFQTSLDDAIQRTELKRASLQRLLIQACLVVASAIALFQVNAGQVTVGSFAALLFYFQQTLGKIS